jgi:hypothetical protein
VSPEERDIVVEHALATEDNLRVALLIMSAENDLFDRIIVNFAECVSARLAERFANSGMWRVTNGIKLDGGLPVGGAISAVHRVGGEQICVRLMYDRDPRQVYYSILNEELPAPTNIEWERITQELTSRFAAGKTNTNSRWTSMADPDYRNWYDWDTLIRLWKKEEAATHFVNRLSAIMGIVASVLHKK